MAEIQQPDDGRALVLCQNPVTAAVDNARMIRFPSNPAPPRRRAFGHLAATELLERFALHGIKALLTLYLLQHVLADRGTMVVGLATLRGWLGGATPLAFASELYGLYGALAYAAVPLGGLLADRLIGRRAAVTTGAALIATGDLVLMQESLLLPALALLIAGIGLMKANLAAQVGALFPPSDRARGRAFTVYLGFLNGGVLLGPLVCGFLAQRYGWSYGFLAAAIAIGVALPVYRALPLFAEGDLPSPIAAAEGRGSLPAALAGILVVTLCFCAYEQVTNLFLVWISRSIALGIGGLRVPPAWFAAMDGLFTIAMVIATTRIRALARLDPADRLIAGCAAVFLGYAILSLATLAGTHSPALPLLVLMLLDLGIALVWPAGLTIVTAAAPPRLVGLVVGLFYLHGFFASLTAGFLGGLYEHMPVPLFWAAHAGMAASAFAIACGVRPILRRVIGGPSC